MTEHLQSVVVGVDGSPQSREAIRWAADFAGRTSSRLMLATAWQWPVSFGAPFGDPEQDARTDLMKAKADLAFPTDRMELVIREGMAGKVLVELSVGASALVVGSRGHGAVAEAVLGSVSAYCVRHAHCPVVVVR